MRLLLAFGRFWYDFVIGDDWKIAASVVVVLAVVAALAASRAWSDAAVGGAGLVLLVLCFSLAVVRDARGPR